MKKGLMIVVSGPAGCGKRTVLRHLVGNEEYAYSVSMTTREPRFDEADGVDYHFVDKDYFLSKIANNDMIEYTEYCGNFYGTPKSESIEIINSGKNLVLEIEIEGAMNIKKEFPDAVLIMLLPPSHSVEEARLRQRGTETDAKIHERLERAKVEITYAPKYDYIVYNHDGRDKEAAEEIAAIVCAEKASAKRNPSVIDDFLSN